MRAFVTGVAGFAGSYLADLLLQRGREVVGLVQDGRTENLAACLAGPAACRLRLVDGDLLGGSLRALVHEVQPQEVYHLAALASVRQSLDDPAATFRVNVLGAQALLDAILAAGLQPRILMVCSGEAYGESARTGQAVTEDAPLLPITPYASSKAAADLLAARYASERAMQIVRVRPFPHTGPRQAAQFFYPDMARQLAEMRAGRQAPILEVGNLEIRRDLTDVRDTVRAYLLTLERGAPGAVYNVCSGRVYALREVLERMIALSGLDVEIRVRAERLRSHDLEVLAGNPEALMACTGWRAEIPLEQTLQDLLEYWRARSAGEETRPR